MISGSLQVELKGCSTDQDLAGWRLMDASGNEFVFGADGCTHSVPANGYLVLSRDEACSFIFGIGDGDELQFFDSNGFDVDTVKLAEGAAPQGKSYARIPEGGDTWLTAAPTKNAYNGDGPQFPQRVVASPDLVTGELVCRSQVLSRPAPVLCRIMLG